MSWQCRMREKPTAEERKNGEVAIGDMWYATWLIEQVEGKPLGASYLSTTYVAERMAHRPPLIVRLPGGIDFCIDSRADSSGGASGWKVTGEPPNITVNPSINATHHYHGFIRDGVITQDCEGRTFDPSG